MRTEDTALGGRFHSLVQPHQNVLLVHISGLPFQGEHEKGLVSGTLTPSWTKVGTSAVTALFRT